MAREDFPGDGGEWLVLETVLQDSLHGPVGVRLAGQGPGGSLLETQLGVVPPVASVVPPVDVVPPEVTVAPPVAGEVPPVVAVVPPVADEVPPVAVVAPPVAVPLLDTGGRADAPPAGTPPPVTDDEG